MSRPRTGTLFLRKDGSWCAQITLDDGRRKSFSGRDKTDVRTRMEEALRLQREGRLVIGSTMKLGDYLSWWLDIVAIGLAHNSYQSYRNAIQLPPELARIPMRTVKAHDIQKWVSRQKSAPTTVRKKLAVVKQALDYAVTIGYIGFNPAEKIVKPRGGNREMRTLTAHQAAVLVSATKGQPDHALWVTLLATGMRVSEAMALYWSDIDFDAGTIRVSHTLEKRDGSWYREPPKGKKQIRVIPVTSRELATLRAWKAQQAELRLAATKWANPRLVFTLTGDPRDRHSAAKALRRDLRAAGLPAVTPHDLRHTAGTLMDAAGESARTIAERLGHADVSLTMRTYVHATDEAQHRAAQKLSDAIWEAS